MIEKTKFEFGSEYGVNDLMKALDYMAIDSALSQVTKSEKFNEFEELVYESINGFYNYSYTKLWFDNKEKLKSFDEWKEFSELLDL